MNTREAVEEAFNELSKSAGAEDVAAPTSDASPPETTETDLQEGQAPIADAQAPVTEPEPLEAPQLWPADAKDRFKNLPRETQEFLLDRDKQMNGDYTRKTQEVARLRNHYEALDKALEPFMPVLASQKKTPAQLVHEMAQLELAMQRNPLETLRHLAATYRVDPSQLVPAQQTQSPAMRDPAIQALLQEVNQLREWKSQQDTLAQGRSASDMELTVRDFAEEKDAKGGLLRPYFNDVAHVVSSLLPQIKSQYPDADNFSVLQAAYEEAMKPYQSLLDAEKQKQIARAKEAKIAGSTVANSGGGVVSVAKPKTTREAVMQAWEELSK